MRTKLGSIGLLLAVVGALLMPIEAVHAAVQGKSTAAAQKSKASPSAAKGKAGAPAQKSVVKPVAQKVAARPVAQKGKVDPVARKGTAKLAKSAEPKGRIEPVARKGKAQPIASNGKLKAVAPVAQKRTARLQAAKAAPSPRLARAPVERYVSPPATPKRHLTRALASSADLWQEPGQLAVASGSALVIGQEGGELLYEKNANAVVPIASITKVMTAMVVLDSLPNLQAAITISDEDVDYLRGSRSRLGVGTVITRETALLLALMSSENRAANALGRHYPGGLPAFVGAMNRKAASLGMRNTRFEDPTGLSSNNVSTAHDLARMVAAAYGYPLIREFSTTPGVRAEVKGRELGFHNTNQLVSSPTWEIGLSKTGYIQEAGKCLVMQARVADKPVVIVLLDSAGKQTRIGDANRIKRWMESASAAGRLPTRV